MTAAVVSGVYGKALLTTSTGSAAYLGPDGGADARGRSGAEKQSRESEQDWKKTRDTGGTPAEQKQVELSTRSTAKQRRWCRVP